MCHFLQGQRLRVRAESRVGGRAGQTAEGELLFAQYGLSGTAILDVSESLSDRPEPRRPEGCLGRRRFRPDP